MLISTSSVLVEVRLDMSFYHRASHPTVMALPLMKFGDSTMADFTQCMYSASYYTYLVISMDGPLIYM